ncbi:hypothetical protein CRG98_001366 [Punica granatum]|uniref:Uncharacterized protein n=1 Tax=Punica granatum TaxID=22663 RepID=A0A2I0LBZ4_PUNGR|nr:hypothetical protein CRG98_001366 [Punica granatum]
MGEMVMRATVKGRKPQPKVMRAPRGRERAREGRISCERGRKRETRERKGGVMIVVELSCNRAREEEEERDPWTFPRAATVGARCSGNPKKKRKEAGVSVPGNGHWRGFCPRSEHVEAELIAGQSWLPIADLWGSQSCRVKEEEEKNT